MKKYLLTLSLISCFSLSLTAQDEIKTEIVSFSTLNYKEEVSIKYNSFSLFENQLMNDSSIYKQEVFPLKKVSGIRYDVVLITNLTTNKKTASIRLTSSSPLSYNEPYNYRYYGYIDSDEITRVIDVLLQYKELFTTDHFSETRYDFVTRGKILFRLHTTSKVYESGESKYLKNCYLRTNVADSSTGNNFTLKEIDKIVAELKEGQKIIEEKLN